MFTGLSHRMKNQKLGCKAIEKFYHGNTGLEKSTRIIEISLLPEMMQCTWETINPASFTRQGTPELYWKLN